MTSSIKDQLRTLSSLQRIEIEMARSEKRLADVDTRIAALNQEVSTFQVQVAEGREYLEGLKKRYRESEAEVKSIESRAAQRNAQLRSVKTNKEYQTMLREIEEMQSKRSDLEDHTLAVLDDIEKSESQVKILKRDLADLIHETEAQQAEIRKAAEIERQELAEWTQERDAIMAALPPKLQKMYDKAKKQGRGIGVAAVIDAVCQVCRMNIPPQMFNELMRLDEMRTCPNCQRIIYPQGFIEEE